MSAFGKVETSAWTRRGGFDGADRDEQERAEAAGGTAGIESDLAKGVIEAGLWQAAKGGLFVQQSPASSVFSAQQLL